MPKNFNDLDMSELEREFELEMEDDHESLNSDELEAEFEGLEGYESYEPELEFEESDHEGGDYADRFYELSQRGYESESQMDEELDSILNEMEQEYFFGGLKKALKKRLPGIKNLIGKIKTFAPALGLSGLTGITGLAQKILKDGSLKGLAKAGLTAAIGTNPMGAAALTALKGLGFEASEDSEANRDAWNNYVDVAREAFESLAENVNERSDEPLEASRQATAAFQTALHKVRARVPHARHGRGIYRAGQAGFPAGQKRRARVIRVRRGERIIIIGE
ncbi:MAG: hypothetical protein WBV94_10935 [Blastocatellia bacterium]